MAKYGVSASFDFCFDIEADGLDSVEEAVERMTRTEIESIITKKIHDQKICLYLSDAYDNEDGWLSICGDIYWD